MNKVILRSIILFFAVLLEVLSSTVWTTYIPLNTCRWVYFIAGISIFLLLAFPLNSITITNNKYNTGLTLVLLCLLVAWTIPYLNTLFINGPLDYTHADMLPVLKVMGERWLSWSDVYDKIPEIWGGVSPIYLPAFYLPFVPAILFDFDMRWITVAFILIPLVFILLKNCTHYIVLSVFIFIGLWFGFNMYERTESLVLSQEGIVYGYYMLLAYFLYSKQILGISIVAVCCLLSRYSGLFFILAFYFGFLLNENKKNSKKLWSFSVFLGIALMTIGQGWGFVSKLFQLPYSYVQNISADTGKYQNVLNDSIGLMPLIGIENHKLVFFLQLFLLILLSIGIIFMAKKIKHPIVYVALLKLSLVLFYNFLILPYMYLMYTSVFVSIIAFVLYHHAVLKFSD